MIYIDQPRERDKNGRPILCAHMVADTLDELHEFALTLGLIRRHFQTADKHPHYDLFGFPLAIVTIKAERNDGVKIVSDKELVLASHLLINKNSTCHAKFKKQSS